MLKISSLGVRSVLNILDECFYTTFSNLKIYNASTNKSSLLKIMGDYRMYEKDTDNLCFEELDFEMEVNFEQASELRLVPFKALITDALFFEKNDIGDLYVKIGQKCLSSHGEHEDITEQIEYLEKEYKTIIKMIEFGLKKNKK